VRPHADFALFLALVSPRLEVRSFRAAPVGDGAFTVRLVLENTGWLPTNVSEKALERKAVRRSRSRSSFLKARASRAARSARRRGARRSRGAPVGYVVEHGPLDERADEGRVGRRARRKAANA
jgi:hypothetical protein